MNNDDAMDDEMNEDEAMESEDNLDKKNKARKLKVQEHRRKRELSESKKA